MNLKTIVPVLLAAVSLAAAQEKENIELTVGGSVMIDLPFQRESFTIVNPKIAGGTPINPQKLQVFGKDVGATDMQVFGVGGQSRRYAIVVRSDLDRCYQELTRMLDDIPEVNLTKSHALNTILVSGKISDMAKWARLQEVMKIYEGCGKNLAEFDPGITIMKKLHEDLGAAGFKTVKKAEGQLPVNTLVVHYTQHTLLISGRVYSRHDLGRIHRIIGAQPWISLAEEKEKEKEITPYDVKGVIEIDIEPVQLSIEGVFVGVTDQQAELSRVNLAKAGLLVVDSTLVRFEGLVGRDQTKGAQNSGFNGSYSINSGLQGALSFFLSDGPGQTYNGMHLTFENDSATGGYAKNGGRIIVPNRNAEITANSNDGSIPGFDYGLIINVKGGLIDPNTVKLDISLELSVPVAIGEDFDLRQNLVTTTITAPLGKTVVMSGMKSLVNQTSLEGVPYLRRIPIMNWLFSEKNAVRDDAQVLILISPKLADPNEPQQIAVVPETKDTYAEARKDPKQFEKERRIARSKKKKWKLFQWLERAR